ncbi:unnamed protein product [Malus baccata var. baccata]
MYRNPLASKDFILIQPLPALLLLRLDFDILVANPRKQKLYIQVNDSLGFADSTIGTGEVEVTQLRAEDE